MVCFKDILIILSPLNFCTSFRIHLLISAKESAEIFRHHTELFSCFALRSLFII